MEVVVDEVLVKTTNDILMWYNNLSSYERDTALNVRMQKQLWIFLIEMAKTYSGFRNVWCIPGVFQQFPHHTFFII